MAYPIFDESGLPARFTVADFKNKCLAAFPVFADTDMDSEHIIESAIDDVYAMFNGVQTLWDKETKQDWYTKTVLCYKLLTMWYIADLYPKYAIGVQSTSGMPILSKKIGDVTLHYFDRSRLNSADDVIASLSSNPYGAKARQMIAGALKRFRLHVAHRIVSL